VDFSSLYQTSEPPSVCFRELLPQPEEVTEDSPTADDLEVAFSRIRPESPVGAQVVLRIVREGQPRGLHPLVRREAYRIGREALLNAFRHSGASRVEVNVEYASKRLRIAVHDDGKGISPELFCSGCRGHRGLSWMQQQAECMGAKLKLLSRVAAGTEVELSIPGHLAFASSASVQRLGWAHV
jgi:signal transduction histidine kinase